MPLTEPDLWISHIRLFSPTHLDRLWETVSAMLFRYQCMAWQTSSLCIKLLTPSSVPKFRDSTGITLPTPLLWVSPTTEAPYFLVASSASWKLPIWNASVLPSSSVNRLFACHGLWPRHIDITLAVNVWYSSGFQEMQPLALCTMEYFGAQYLHLRCGWHNSFPEASYDLLPPYTLGSVPTWWLIFDRAGLSSRFTLALLGARIKSP